MCITDFFLCRFFSLLCTDDKDSKKSQKILEELENIDDECDQNDIAFVKIDDDKEAEEWGIDEIPTIVKFFFALEWFENFRKRLFKWENL